MSLKCGDKVSLKVLLIIKIEPTEKGEIIEVNEDTVCMEFIQPAGNNLKVVVPKRLIQK